MFKISLLKIILNRTDHVQVKIKIEAKLQKYFIYLNWFDTFSENYPVKKIIYVKTEPKVCFERIEKRSRQGESTIPLEYLNECDIYHEKMMDELNVEKLILDGNIDIYENKEKLDEWSNSIKKFII